MKKVYIKTLGCQINEYDSYIISNLLRKYLNILEVNDINNADICILNTCSIREKAEEKVFSELGLWRKIKKEKNIIICLGGCVPVIRGKDIYKKVPFVDIIFGPSSLYKLPEMINKVINSGTKVYDISIDNIKKFNHVFEENNTLDISSSLTIIEGCDKYCSYCVVPYSRGYEKSRSFNSIISEIYVLAIQGVKDITLLGQNVSSYNGVMDNNDSCNLSLLLTYINGINGIERIKFISSHPIDFVDDLFKSYVKNHKLSNHLHLPLQSGSDKILNLMNREYDTKSYMKIIETLNNIRPNMTISTDIIVGFPGETDKDFEYTYNFIEKIGFDMSFVYLYSKRPGTFSYNLKDDIELNIKKKRLFLLNKLFTKNSKRITESMIGTVQKVLVYKYENNNLIGKTDNNRTVVICSEENYVGKMINVFIKDKSNFNLIGNLI